MKISAVLLDLDGTLRDTRDAIYGALQHAIKVHTGQDVSRVDIKPHVHHHTAVHQEFASGVSEDQFTETYMNKVYDDLAHASLYEGVEQLLSTLQAGNYQLAIVTSATQDKTEDFLVQRGLADYFQVVVGMTADRRPKPAPDLLETALSKLRQQPASAIMVGDMVVDIQAAHAVGIPCIAVTHGFGSRDELRDADYLIDSLSELPALLEKLQNE